MPCSSLLQGVAHGATRARPESYGSTRIKPQTADPPGSTHSAPPGRVVGSKMVANKKWEKQ